jgi:hypothetical protein
MTKRKTMRQITRNTSGNIGNHHMWCHQSEAGISFLEELDTHARPGEGKLDAERFFIGTPARDINLTHPRPHTRPEAILLSQ